MIQLAPGKTPAAELRTIYQATFQGALKRSFDIVTAVAGLLILSPVFLIVAVLIKLDSPGPVFFKQIRVGRQRRRARRESARHGDAPGLPHGVRARQHEGQVG